MKKLSLNYQGIEFPYTLYRKDVKNINLRINAEGEISVSANSKIPQKKIDEFLESKAEWIFRSLAGIERAKELRPDSDIYDGKSVYFLGNEYIIQIEQNDEEYVEIDEDVIFIRTDNENDPEHIRNLYIDWLMKMSEVEFDVILDRILPVVAQYNIKKPEIYIRDMKTRWGTCIPENNRIGLNLQLIKSSESCIEQVVLHELVHFIHKNHSKEFYDILTELMPDWQDRKNDLEIKYKDGI